MNKSELIELFIIISYNVHVIITDTFYWNSKDCIVCLKYF